MKTSKKINGVFVGVKGLRIKAWVTAVMTACGRKTVEETVERLTLLGVQTDSNKWYRYNSCTVEPSSDFIDEIDAKLPGTAQVFDSGPDGFPLWNILEGSEDDCLKVIDREILSLTGLIFDEANSFHQRVKTIFFNRLPADIDPQKLWTLIDDDRTKEFHEDFNVVALTTREPESCDGNLVKVSLDGNIWTRETSIITLSAGQVITTIALYVLSRKKKELVPHCHYLMKGMLKRAIQEQLTFGALITNFLSGPEWTYDKLK